MHLKDCPRCSATLASYITRCDCGYSFVEIEDPDPVKRLLSVAEDEKLYEEYLSARAEQASSDEEFAAAAAQADPANHVKAKHAAQAAATREAVLNELNHQRLRTAEILAAIAAARTSTAKKTHATTTKSAQKSVDGAVVTDIRPASPPVFAEPANPPRKNVVRSVKKPAAKPKQPEIPVQTSPPPQVGKPAEVTPASPSRAAAPTADEPQGYIAKLEEILLFARHAQAVPAPRASLSYNLPYAVKPQSASTPVIALHTPSKDSAASGTTSTIEGPVSPEMAIELAARAVKTRAEEMAHRHAVTRTTPSAHPFARARIQDAVRSAAEGIRETMTTSGKRAIPPTDLQDHAETSGSSPAGAVNTPQANAHPPIVASQPFIDDRPSATFRAAQAERAEKIVQNAAESVSGEPKQCPNCSAIHASTADRCGCGYLFGGRVGLPVLMLSAKDQSDLSEGKYTVANPKRPER